MPELDDLENEIKVGARNSRTDAQRLQMIHDYSVENGAACDAENTKAVELGGTKVEDTLITFGDAVKAARLDSGDVKLSGYLVRFGDASNTDLTGDYFTAQTDFGKRDTSDGWFNHRMPVKYQGKSFTYADQLPDVKLTRDDVGIFAEIIIGARNEYEKAIAAAGLAGRLGWSSGTAPHLVDRKPAGKSNEIIKWPLGLDASLTPTPAEPFNGVTSLKTYQPTTLDIEATPQAAQENRDEAQTSTAVSDKSIKLHEGETMSDEQFAELKTLITAQGAQISALETVVKTAPAVQTIPAVAHVEVVSDPADVKFFDVAEQCRAIKAAVKTQGRQYDVRLSRLDSLKAIQGASESVPEDGGYLLEPTVTPELMKPLHSFDAFSSAAHPMPVKSNSNSGWLNGVDETDMSAGLTWGGVIAYRVAEGGTITKSKPKFRRINWQLKKYAALVYDTDELLQDAGQFQEVANQACNEAIVFLQNDDIVRGDGAAGCWGILNNGSLVTVTKETNQAASTVLVKNLSKMWQRLLPQSRPNSAWYINSEVEPELDVLSIPAGTGALEPRFVTYDQTGAMKIKGRPVVVTPFNSALSAVGDIILADMSSYLMWTKGGIQSAQSIHVEFLTDQNVFRFIARADGQPVLASAITPFKGTATQSNFVTLGAR